MNANRARNFFTTLFFTTLVVACGGGDAPLVCPPNVHPIVCAPRPDAGVITAPEGTTNNPAESAGLWQGSTSSGRQVYAVLLSNGTYWFIYTAVGDPTRIAGAGEGTANSSGGTLASVNGLDFNMEGLGVLAASITATYSSRNSLSGTVRYPNQTVSFSTRFVNAPAASLSQIAGNYRGTAAVVAAVEGVNLTISPSGMISGISSSGCSFSGAATPRTDVAVFDLAVTFAGGNCALQTSTVKGVAFFDMSLGQFVSAALNPGRTNGFLALGSKL